MMREKRGEGVRENEREREKVLEGVGRKRQASRVDEERESGGSRVVTVRQN